MLLLWWHLGQKSQENISIYDISYKNLIYAKPLCLRSANVDGFFKVYDGTKYLIFTTRLDILLE